MTEARNRPGGFTLMEVIALLVVLGIATAVAMASMAQDDSSLVAGTDRLAEALRYAQARSMASDSSTNTSEFYTASWGIYIPNSSEFGLYFCDDPASCSPSAQLRVLPGNTSTLVEVGVVVNSPTNSISFDKFGRPYQAGSTNPATANIEISLVKDGQTRKVRVYSETGYVEIVS